MRDTIPAKTGLAEELNTFFRQEDPSSIDRELQKKLAFDFGRVCQDAFNEYREKESTWRLRPSGQKCAREQALIRLGLAAPMDPTAQGPFIAGKIGEAYTFAVLQLMGRNVFDQQREVKVPYGSVEDPSWTWLNGHIDGRVMIGTEPVLLDVKTTTSVGFRKIDTELTYGGDPWGYKRQLKSYMMSPDILDTGRAGLLYMTKEYWNEWAEVAVRAPTHEDRERWNEHCSSIMAAEKDNLRTWPKRPAFATFKRRPRAESPTGQKGCLEIDGLQCKYCRAVQPCWSDVGDFVCTSRRFRIWRADT